SRTLYVAAKTKQPRPRGILCAHGGVCRATPIEDDRNIDQGFHVVDDRRLAEETGLRGERWLVARLAAMSFNGIKERRFLTADVSASTAPEFDIKTQAAAKNVRAKKAFPSRSFN